ncbi:hypothetical protein [Clostridium sp. YIM B02569]|uniref:hypothetical protein n=1 Tax=Clostridium sp. YIM B02569 TaxID=2911967 RepID=UPI001EEB9EDF|nr:hypothetical protein [Clostridium sp. YIM B02569]
MKILFCNIAWMDYYKGVTKKDRPKNGGSWVKDNDDAHEAYNFETMTFDGDDTKYCLGFLKLRQLTEKIEINCILKKFKAVNYIRMKIQ